MSDERIKDVNGGTPRAVLSTDRIPIDSDAGGTGIGTPAGVVSRGVADGGFIPQPLDDFTGSGAEWKVATVGSGTAKLMASGSAYGFKSRGIALLSVTAAASDAAEILRWKTGSALGAGAPIVHAWRIFIAGRPADSSVCTMLVGVSGATGVDAVGIRLAITSSTITANLNTYKAGVDHLEAFAFPAGTAFVVRLTIAETGTKVEISADDGVFATVLDGAIPPTQTGYAPWARVERTTSNGAGTLVIDSFDAPPSRGGLDAGAPVDDSSDFAGPSAVTPAAIGITAIGTAQWWARSDHVHAADGLNVALTGLTAGDWTTSPPANVKAAINRMSALLKTLNGGSSIP